MCRKILEETQQSLFFIPNKLGECHDFTLREVLRGIKRVGQYGVFATVCRMFIVQHFKLCRILNAMDMPQMMGVSQSISQG
jgi:hypothetical protein